jgi:hypothetical protein
MFMNYLGRLPQGMNNHPLLKCFIKLILQVFTMSSSFERISRSMTKKQRDVTSTLVLAARSVKEVFTGHLKKI